MRRLARSAQAHGPLAGSDPSAARRHAPGPSAVDRPLRIWHVNVGNHAGTVDGVATVSTQLASDQAALGHHVVLVVAADPAHHGAIGDATGPGVELLLAEPRAALATARRALDDPRTRPDAVHLHSVFRPAHRILAGHARRAHVPVVLSPHAGLAPLLLQRDRLRKWAYGHAVERRFHRWADGVHALQLVERDDVVAYCGAARPVEVVANPVAPELLAAPRWRGSAAARPRVVLLCRYDVYQKGLDRLDAVARRLPDVDFRVHGNPDKNARGQAAALAAAAPPNLRFEPPVLGDDKLRALREADLFLLPSRVEGLSVSLVEAMTLGVPCAVSAYVGRSLEMDERGTALVLDDAPAAAAAQLAVLLADPQRRSALGRAAADHAARHFAPGAVAAAHIAHYRRLLTRAPAAAVSRR